MKAHETWDLIGVLVIFILVHGMAFKDYASRDAWESKLQVIL
jgi:hypothetical protein